MILYLIIVLTLLFMILNYILDGFDLFNPAVIFCAMAFLSSCMCLVYQPIYGFELHVQTLVVFAIAILIFTWFNLWSINTYQNKTIISQKLDVIHPEKEVTIAIIFIEILTLFSTRSYVRYVAGEFGRKGSYSDCLNMYNHISKFTQHFIDGSLRAKPKLMTIGEPFCTAAALIFIIIFLNNCLAKASKIQLVVDVIPVLLDFMICFSRGSRTAAFTILTGGLFVYYTLWHYKKGYFKGQLKFIVYAISFGILCVVGFTLVRTLIGRQASTIGESLFPYLGGPIVNLDLFLQSKVDYSPIFGKETFIYVIRYIGQKFEIKDFVYTANLPFNSLNGINVGNVYTTFYAWIQDFGYIGVVVLMSFMSWYYTKTYTKIKKGKIKLFSFSFISYIYIFNSLIMLMFSNRFYEDVFNPVFVKILFFVIILKYFLLENGMVYLKRGKIRIVRKKYRENKC